MAQIRSRLSDFSWWMRLLCQKIAQRANRDDTEVGKFWQARFRAVRLLDEAALLACAAYVDLNPIRAAIAETLEASDYTSVQARLRGLQHALHGSVDGAQVAPGTSGHTSERCPATPARPDAHLAPLTIDERTDPLGPHLSKDSGRASDKGFLNLSLLKYLELLDWTAREIRPGKRGSSPAALPPVLERIGLSKENWCELVREFGRLFRAVAGRPHAIDLHTSSRGSPPHRLKPRVRELLT